ncbi:unnamed protein product [Meloidogyne enterolobii]|uniref:Uncharacterized protein n=1 Tax=Meloidogyne enterolobii TaxID=390850 RepID=A0ACB1ABC1_MELEN
MFLCLNILMTCLFLFPMFCMFVLFECFIYLFLFECCLFVLVECCVYLFLFECFVYLFLNF